MTTAPQEGRQSNFKSVLKVPLLVFAGVFGAVTLMSSSTLSLTARCEESVEAVDPLEFTVRISNGSSAGSGFLISEDGFIVTNAHVISFATRGNVQVTFADGTKYSGKIHSSDTVTDLALIKIEPIEGVPFKIARLGSTSSVRAGDAITAVGAPHHLQNTVSQGTVSAPLRHEFEINMPTTYEAYIQTDVSTNPGSSGGPLLNQAGEVIGVHSRKHSGGWGLAIPIDRVKEVIAQLKEKKKVVRPYFGMDLADHTRGKAAHSVVVVNKVAPGSPVESAGIRK
jgi:S1-C subfamily serine protease